MNRVLLALLLTAVAGCTETIELTHDPLANLESLEVVPDDAKITITDLAPPYHTLQYQAMGRFRDGSTQDVTGLVTWSIANEALGAFEPSGLFVTSAAAVGTTRVLVTSRELAVETGLTVTVDATILDSTFPPPAGQLFPPGATVITGDATRSPELLYPADETVFPRTLSRTLFQIARGDLNDAASIQFDNELLHLVVETGSDRWAADGTIQQLISSAAEQAPIRTEIRATSSTAPASIYGSTPTTFTVSRDTPGGALYFWSASTNGIMRGRLDATSAAKLYPGQSTCVGCHALARDGAQLAMGSENGASFDLLSIDVGTLATVVPASLARPMGWATYSPDGSRLVVANNGVLTEYDAHTGAVIGTISVGNTFATHPHRSPDGASLAIAMTGAMPTNRDVKAASIAVLARSGTTWSAPQVLLTGSNSSNNYFPRWSPDGSVLAFVHATTASQGAASAELMIMPKAGGSPTPLAKANYRVGHVDMPALSNTMPVWAPYIGQHAWLAFVSARPYGNVLAGGRGQIWISAVDLNNPTAPSHPAFWLPSQDVTVLNYNPSWSGEAITP